MFYLEYCFVSYGAPAFAAFASILLTDTFIYLLSSNFHSIHLSLLSLLLIEVSSVIPVSSEAFNACAYHSPIRSAFEVAIGNIVLIVELHFLNASENSMMPSLTSTSTANYNT